MALTLLAGAIVAIAFASSLTSERAPAHARHGHRHPGGGGGSGTGRGGAQSAAAGSGGAGGSGAGYASIARPNVYLPAAITSGSPRHRAIALTFDDGPGPYTSRILTVLNRYHAGATFFLVGQQLVDFRAQALAAMRDHFALGDHTENHAWLIRLNAAGQYGQIDDDLLRMRNLHAPRPWLFRPPYGSMNRTTFNVIRALRMTAILWSVDPSDWRRPGTATIVERVLSRARPGAIVLLHDGGGDRSQTLAALPKIIRGLERRGYRLLSVPALLALDPPPRHPHLPSFVSDK